MNTRTHMRMMNARTRSHANTFKTFPLDHPSTFPTHTLVQTHIFAGTTSRHKTHSCSLWRGTALGYNIAPRRLSPQKIRWY